MKQTDVVIIGAGQAGLALSHCLQARAIDHLVIERGRVAERWRSERWDSLRLLTPNWQSRLPGYRYRGHDPHGYMSMAQVAAYFEGYARTFAAPVQSHTRVLAVDPYLAGYRVRTDRGDYYAQCVVVATGHCDVPLRPAQAAHLSSRLHQLSPTSYRNPAQLPPGGVLVVGASASGAQIADELARAGRHVTLSVGRHTRLVRRYRGADIMYWLDRIGLLDERREDIAALHAAKRQPSLQLMGTPEGRNLDLATLQALGVRLCGRLVEARGTTVRFSDDLPAVVRRSERKLARVLDRIDRHLDPSGVRAAHDPLVRPAPVRVPRAERSLHLGRAGITNVIWATGFRRDYAWLHVPVLDAAGEIVQQDGVTRAEGLYTLGMRLQRTRKSSFIDGVGADAEFIARHITARLGAGESAAA